MPHEKTAGGLLVVPNIYFMSKEEVPGYVSPSRQREMFGDGDVEVDIDPFKNYKSSLFDRPTTISFEFFDPKKDLAVDPVLAKAGQTKPSIMDSPTNRLVKFDGQNPEVEWGDEGVINMTTNMNAQLGFNSVPGQHHHNPSVETVMSDEEMGKLFTELARKAGENLVSGKVKREELAQFAARDNCIYKGNELTEFDYSTDYYTERAAHALKDTLPNAIAKQLEGIAKGNGKQFKDILPAIESPVKKSIAAKLHKPEPSALRHVTGNTLLSTIVHGIGEKDFLSTFLDTFKAMRPKAVDAFLGSENKLDNALGSIITRALPIGSTYHTQLVKNHYKNRC